MPRSESLRVGAKFTPICDAGQSTRAPGSEVHFDAGQDNRWWLSRVTEAGGTSPGDCYHDQEPYCHYDTTVSNDYATALSDAFEDASEQVANCAYPLPLPSSEHPANTEELHLILEGSGTRLTEVYRAPSSQCTHGWCLDTDRAVLCPATCEAVLGDSSLELQWLVGCGEGPLSMPN